MKRLLIILMCVATLGLAMTADHKAKVTFDTTVIDLGNIPADGGVVRFEYPFANTGDRPLVILSVSNGGCGCTKPTFPREPIQPGGRGKVSITFDPTGRQGELNRVVKVRTNGSPSTVKLRFKGVVIPRR